MGEAALDISLDDHSLLEDFERDSSANDLSPDEKLALFHQLQATRDKATITAFSRNVEGQQFEEISDNQVERVDKAFETWESGKLTRMRTLLRCGVTNIAKNRGAIGKIDFLWNMMEKGEGKSPLQKQAISWSIYQRLDWILESIGDFLFSKEVSRSDFGGIIFEFFYNNDVRLIDNIPFEFRKIIVEFIARRVAAKDRSLRTTSIMYRAASMSRGDLEMLKTANDEDIKWLLEKAPLGAGPIGSEVLKFCMKITDEDKRNLVVKSQSEVGYLKAIGLGRFESLRLRDIEFTLNRILPIEVVDDLDALSSHKKLVLFPEGASEKAEENVEKIAIIGAKALSKMGTHAFKLIFEEETPFNSKVLFAIGRDALENEDLYSILIDLYNEVPRSKRSSVQDMAEFIADFLIYIGSERFLFISETRNGLRQLMANFGNHVLHTGSKSDYVAEGLKDLKKPFEKKFEERIAEVREAQNEARKLFFGDYLIFKSKERPTTPNPALTKVQEGSIHVRDALQSYLETPSAKKIAEEKADEAQRRETQVAETKKQIAEQAKFLKWQAGRIEDGKPHSTEQYEVTKELEDKIPSGSWMKDSIIDKATIKEGSSPDEMKAYVEEILALSSFLSGFCMVVDKYGKYTISTIEEFTEIILNNQTIRAIAKELFQHIGEMSLKNHYEDGIRKLPRNTTEIKNFIKRLKAAGEETNRKLSKTDNPERQESILAGAGKAVLEAAKAPRITPGERSNLTVALIRSSQMKKGFELMRKHLKNHLARRVPVEQYIAILRVCIQGEWLLERIKQDSKKIEWRRALMANISTDGSVKNLLKYLRSPDVQKKKSLRAIFQGIQDLDKDPEDREQVKEQNLTTYKELYHYARRQGVITSLLSDNRANERVYKAPADAAEWDLGYAAHVTKQGTVTPPPDDKFEKGFMKIFADEEAVKAFVKIMRPLIFLDDDLELEKKKRLLGTLMPQENLEALFNSEDEEFQMEALNTPEIGALGKVIKFYKEFQDLWYVEKRTLDAFTFGEIIFNKKIIKKARTILQEINPRKGIRGRLPAGTKEDFAQIITGNNEALRSLLWMPSLRNVALRDLKIVMLEEWIEQRLKDKVQRIPR
ncbi:hypothetical protein HOE67_02460 [Candidatus Peregrinibacteria bacterium]|nr:hypothetical protein [Candidatus Peregrinibacteria bacterium]